MQGLRFLFAPQGRLAPQSFLVAASVVYLLGAASHFLTSPPVIARAGLWPFVAVQTVLIWIWFVLHARRLHDSGRTAALAVGVALLYVLSIVLLLFVADAFFNTSDSVMHDPNAASALGLILMLYIIDTLLGSLHYDFAWLVVAILIAMAFVPIVVALGFTLWTATRPSLPGS
jgi:uncharacterized membrane protein YhaH (DUF805 family)